MAKFRLTFKRSVAKDLRSIHNADVTRILKTIESLRVDPRPSGCVKLSAQELYRIRRGRYRILYEIRDENLIIQVVRVAHRSVVYQNDS